MGTEGSTPISPFSKPDHNTRQSSMAVESSPGSTLMESPMKFYCSAKLLLPFSSPCTQGMGTPREERRVTGSPKRAATYLQHHYKATKAICASGQQNPQQELPSPGLLYSLEAAPHGGVDSLGSYGG